MKQSEAKAILSLVVIGIIVYPFVWLYEQTGPIGLGILVALVIAGFVLSASASRKRDEKEFNKLVIYVLNNRLPPNEAKKINNKLMKSNFPRSALIRRLQILRDSVELSLTSKKRDTAESRFCLVKECYEEIKNEHFHLVKPETMEAIAEVVDETEKQFYTNLYTNSATAYLEKAQKLKTDKSKKKYLQLAKDIIEEGLEDTRSQKNELKSILGKVKDAELAVESTN